MLRIIEGNLLDTERGIIVHQCNCQGAYGAGIAKQIAKRWPQAKLAYLDHLTQCSASHTSPLGTYCCVPINNNLTVINMLTQYYYGNAARTGRCYTNYEAFDKALRNIREAYPNECIYVPHNIGCGLAGGQWHRVSNILDQYDIIAVKLPE